MHIKQNDVSAVPLQGQDSESVQTLFSEHEPCTQITWDDTNELRKQKTFTELKHIRTNRNILFQRIICQPPCWHDSLQFTILSFWCRISHTIDLSTHYEQVNVIDVVR